VRSEWQTADAGYCSERNLTEPEAAGPELFVNTTKDWKRRKALREAPPPRGRIPKHLTATQRMERTLRTKRGAALYTKRSQTVDPVFGQIKDTRGLDGFCRRGLSPCDSEWAVICASAQPAEVVPQRQGELKLSEKGVDTPPESVILFSNPACRQAGLCPGRLEAELEGSWRSVRGVHATGS